MSRKRKSRRGLSSYKRMLRKADRRRIKQALCRINQDECRAYKRSRYNPWAWD